MNCFPWLYFIISKPLNALCVSWAFRQFYSTGAVPWPYRQVRSGQAYRMPGSLLTTKSQRCLSFLHVSQFTVAPLEQVAENTNTISNVPLINQRSIYCIAYIPSICCSLCMSLSKRNERHLEKLLTRKLGRAKTKMSKRMKRRNVWI